jgi:hypothetical protein
MAKRQARTSTSASRQQVEDAAANLLRRSALTLSRDGWNPALADRSVFAVVSRMAREMWPRDEASRDRAAARAFAMLLERLRRRYPAIALDAWERDAYREPEDVIATLACSAFPWQAQRVLSPQETTIEAFMVLQVLNSPDIAADALTVRARQALPADWITDAGQLQAMSVDVIGRVRSA